MARKKIWITGSKGSLGSCLAKRLNHREVTILKTDLDVDVCQLHSVMDYVTINRPDIIVNCAAITDPVQCEADIVNAFRVNAIGARNLSTAAHRINAVMIQLSTDDVFGGDAKKTLTEFDPPTPATVYGKSKLAGENFVRDLNPRHMIIRSAWVYGYGETDFINTILAKAKAGQPLELPIDEVSTPTSVDALADFLISLMNTEEYGIYHATCEGVCSRYDFANAVLRLGGYPDYPLQKVSKQQIENKDSRPNYTLMENLMMKITGVYEMPRWEQALEEHMKGANR